MSIEERTKVESERYRRLYAEKGYPKGNPERLLIWAGCNLAARVLDLGCGRASLAGIFGQYTGIDFTDAGFPKYHPAPPPSHRYIVAPLAGNGNWTTLPEVMLEEFDLVVCADVMEHIAPEDVGEVLANINRANARRLLFSISTVESRWKDEAGQLHLTVQPPSWWYEKAKETLSAFVITRSCRVGTNLFLEAVRAHTNQPNAAP